MKNNFIILVPFYNVSSFLKECLDSILSQTYKNYQVILLDDASNDDFMSVIPEGNESIKLLSQKNRTTALENLISGLNNIQLTSDNDIIVILDGDDTFLNEKTLENLNKIYNDENCMISYGQYVSSSGQIGHCQGYLREEFENLRSIDWRASHLRSFKYSLWLELLKQDSTLVSMKDSNNEFYKMTYDIALMFPLMEIAGFDNINFNRFPNYWYRIHEKNDHFVDRELQRNIEMEIRNKSKFKQIF